MSNLAKVEFKPLNGSTSDESDDDDDDYLNEDDNEFTSNSRLAYRKFKIMQDVNSNKRLGHLVSDNNSRSLLRIYLVAIIIVMLIFANWNHIIGQGDNNKKVTNVTRSGITTESSYPSQEVPKLTDSREDLIVKTTDTSGKLSAISASIVNLDISSRNLPKFNLSSIQKDDFSMQSYETYMDTVLQERNLINRPDQLDDLRISLNQRYSIQKWWSLGSRVNGKYVTVTNYVRAIKSFNQNSTITYSTQASPDFLHHTVEICKRWDGPISLAVFATGPALTNAITIIKFMRDCLPSPLRNCIRDKVTWHIIYESEHGPKPENLGYPREYLNYAKYSPFVKHDECPKLSSQDAKQMVKEFSEQLAKLIQNEPRHLYPINVLRNVARLASNTRHILACDIELYPSLNLVPLFANFINKHKIDAEYNMTKYVFALPIFELKANVTPPKTKLELAKLFDSGDAIFFHKFVCDYCQDFPNRRDWIHSLESASDDELSIFVKTQRDRYRSSWEPIFIGTNDDPLYDDRLTWDGRRDKMGQMYEMCLQDYYILIVDNAFLVHSPGIKHIDKDDMMKRVQYIVDNNQIYDSTMARLKKLYANSDTIKKC